MERPGEERVRVGGSRERGGKVKVGRGRGEGERGEDRKEGSWSICCWSGGDDYSHFCNLGVSRKRGGARL